MRCDKTRRIGRKGIKMKIIRKLLVWFVIMIVSGILVTLGAWLGSHIMDLTLAWTLSILLIGFGISELWEAII